jgi:hypothetical protein
MYMLIACYPVCSLPNVRSSRLTIDLTLEKAYQSCWPMQRQDQPHQENIGASDGALGYWQTMLKEAILPAVSSEIPVESCFSRKCSIILAIVFDGK